MTRGAIDDISVLEAACDWLADGFDVCLATVLQTWGSAPRRAGSHLAVRSDGLFVGSVSGGCVERHVVETAQDVMGQRTARIVEYGVANEDAWEVGLACGGTIRVGISDVSSELDSLRSVVDAARSRRPGALTIRFDQGGSPVVARPPEGGTTPLDAMARRGLDLLDDPEQPLQFHRIYRPAVRVVIIGAVHIARALSSMASLLGHQVVVIDPRRAFAAPENWPGVALVHDYPDEAFEHLEPDHRTAIVALTHDPKIDDPGLEAALRSDAFYIGALGSKRTHQRRLERLSAAGFESHQLDRIHGPVGLHIGAANPAEIAVAILAEITATLRLTETAA